MPFYPYSDHTDAFTEITYEHDWILPGFDWPTGKGTAEAAALRDDPETLAEATHEQLAQLLTVLV